MKANQNKTKMSHRRRRRHHSPSPESLSPASSPSQISAAFKNRRNFPKSNVSVYDDSREHSRSQSPAEPDDFEDDQSESITNVHRTNNLTSNSASNSSISPPITHIDSHSNIQMVMRIFPATPESEAAGWYDISVEPDPSLSWEEIKSSFIEAYRRFEYSDGFRSELMTINQGHCESVGSYYMRLQWILKRWPQNGVPDHLLKVIFTDGLKGDFKDWVVSQKPDSLAESLSLAKVWEGVRSVRLATTINVQCGFCGGRHEEEDCDIKVRMRELWVKTKDKKQLKDCSEIIGSDDGIESPGSAERSGVAEGSEKGEVLVVQKKSSCQCSKHLCWKKRLGRTNSITTVKSDIVP